MTNFEKWKAGLTPEYLTTGNIGCRKCPLRDMGGHPCSCGGLKYRDNGDICRDRLRQWASAEAETVPVVPPSYAAAGGNK